eukprot:scaffold2343_cov115-Skeletonema_dohrnii-CCMP3373.AAC.13
MGSAVDSFSLILFKTFTPALLSHHNSIAQGWKLSVAGLPIVDRGMKSKSNVAFESIETIRNIME